MNTYYLLVSNPPTNVQNITEEQKEQETTHVEKAKISELYGEKFWNAEMEKDLIKLIKEEECLWNVYCRTFHSRKNKHHAVDKVIKEMKRLWPDLEYLLTYDKCLSKFKNLRTYYQKEKKKQLNNKLRNIPHNVRWIHYEDMSFIDASDSPFKIENVQSNQSPIIIQFTSNRDSPLDVNEENMDVSRMLEQGNSSSAEDQLSNEDRNGVSSFLDIHSSSEFKEIPPKVKKKVFKPKVGTASPNKIQKTNNIKSSSTLKKISSKLKNNKQCVTQVIPVNSNLFSKPQTVEITHDEAFANFIAKDLGKIPEGKQKEQLRFKILELIHNCKMDTNLFD